MNGVRGNDLGTVQETLLIPLWAKAVETRQPEPILRDAKAVEMVESIDYDFDKFAKGKASQAGCCLRASFIDGLVRQFFQEHPRGAVVEIGVGLDARFERLDNGVAQWFELDLPDVIEMRRRFFQETERRRFVSQSVLTPDWISVVKQSGSQPVMFVAEGVLMYFEEEQVKGLFSMLVEHFPGSAFVFCAMSPLVVRMQNRHDTIKHVSARFRWGISKIEEIETWDPRYKIERSAVFADLTKKYRKRFPLGMHVMSFLWPPFKRGYGIHLVQLGENKKGHSV